MVIFEMMIDKKRHASKNNQIYLKKIYTCDSWYSNEYYEV